ncbi:MAG: hypothetical protein DMG36_23660 [Acidobacteria bacterium]|nr:MAG: hypothetical protein DMG36_23660 [Acidobacteriota bacterium]
MTLGEWPEFRGSAIPAEAHFRDGPYTHRITVPTYAALERSGILRFDPRNFLFGSGFEVNGDYSVKAGGLQVLQCRNFRVTRRNLHRWLRHLIH